MVMQTHATFINIVFATANTLTLVVRMYTLYTAAQFLVKYLFNLNAFYSPNWLCKCVCFSVCSSDAILYIERGGHGERSANEVHKTRAHEKTCLYGAKWLSAYLYIGTAHTKTIPWHICVVEGTFVVCW